MPCDAIDPVSGVICEYPPGHKADGTEVFAFHGGRTKTGKYIAWTDNAAAEVKRRPRQQDDPLLPLPLPPQTGEVYACLGATRDGRDVFQCEKVRDHAGNHVAHRSDGSMVVWA